MTINWKKLALWALMIFVLLLTYSAWKLNRSERQLDALFQTGLAPTDSSAGVRADRTQLRVFGGELIVYGLQYFNSEDEPAWRSEAVRVRIGTWKSLQMGLLPTAYVLGRLDRTEMRVERLIWAEGSGAAQAEGSGAGSGAAQAEGSGAGSGVDLDLTLYGSPFLLFPVLGEGRFPPGDVRLTAESSDVSVSLLSRIAGVVSNLGGEADGARGGWLAMVTEEVGDVRVSADLEINRQRSRLQVNRLRMYSPVSDFGISFSLNSQYQNLSTTNGINRLMYPDFLEINLSGIFSKTMRESGFAVGTGTRVSAESFTWQLNSSGNPADSLTVFSILSRPEQSRFELTRPTLFPEPGLLGPLEQFLILFGVPVNRFDFIELTIDYESNTGNQSAFVIHQAELMHPHFRMFFEGEVQRLNGEIGAFSPIQGVLRVDQMSDGLRNASRNLEDLFGLRFRRSGEAIVFPVSGTLGAPNIF
jgi:hypothetical protein